MFVNYKTIAETPKMFIGKNKLTPKSVQLGIRESAGGNVLISLGDAKKASKRIVNYVNEVMAKSTLSPEEKSLMLKAIYK